MKFQSIYIFIAFFAVVGFSQVIQNQSGKLSEKENLERLKTCGTVGIPRTSTNIIGQPVNGSLMVYKWLRFIYNKEILVSSASIISSRHLIASSILVVNFDDRTWKHNKTNVICGNEMDLEVPKEAIAQLEFPYSLCKSNCKAVSIIKAYILNYCLSDFKNLNMPLPIVFETEENMTEGVPCLPERWRKLTVDGELDAYGLNRKHPGSILHRKVKILDLGNEMLHSEHYNNPSDYGGPLVDVDNNNISTIVGIGMAAMFPDSNSTFTGFFKLADFQYNLCKKFGICERTQMDRRLSDEENEQRLQSCGKGDLPRPSNDTVSKPVENSYAFMWLGYVPQKNIFTASLISPRHFLTSSIIVIDKDRNWKFNKNLSSDDAHCKNGKDLEIPPQASDWLDVFYKKCTTKCKGVRVVRAYILNFCDSKLNTANKRLTRTFPMVVEVAEDIDEGAACLADQLTRYHLGDELDAYGYGEGKSQAGMKHRKVKLFYKTKKLLSTNSDNTTKEFAGALVKIDNGLRTIIGIGATSVPKDTKNYFGVQYFQDNLCETVGICGRKRQTRKLTEEENDRRLIFCGNHALPRPSNLTNGVLFKGSDYPALRRIPKQSNDTFNWLYWVEGTERNSVQSAASMISSRHFITSSQVVLTDEMKWIFNDQDLDKKNCKAGSNDGYVEVPPSALDDLEFGMNTCHDSSHKWCKFEYVKPVKAYILHVCHKKILSKSKEFHLPMLVEIEDEFMGSTPCLNKTSNIDSGILHAYGYRNRNMVHKVGGKTSKDTRDLIVIQSEHMEGDSEGPLIKIHDDGTWSIVGFGAMAPSQATQGSTAYFDIQPLLPVFCELAGICWRDMSLPPSYTIEFTRVPPKGSNTGIPETATSPLPMNNTNLITEPLIGTSMETPSPPEVPPANETPEKTNVDEQYEEFLEKEHIKMEDYDVDNDFFVSEDFLNEVVSRRNCTMELLVLVLIFVFYFF